MSRAIFNWIGVLRAPSNLAWNVSRDGAAPTSLGSPCQCFTTFTVKNVFLASSQNLPSLSLKPLLLVLLQQALLKRLLGVSSKDIAMAGPEPCREQHRDWGQTAVLVLVIHTCAGLRGWRLSLSPEE